MDSVILQCNDLFRVEKIKQVHFKTTFYLMSKSLESYKSHNITPKKAGNRMVRILATLLSISLIFTFCTQERPLPSGFENLQRDKKEGVFC